MYHEEIIIDGVLNWRGTPDGEFQPYTAKQLSSLVQTHKQKHGWALDRLRRINEVIGDWFDE